MAFANARISTFPGNEASGLMVVNDDTATAAVIGNATYWATRPTEYQDQVRYDAIVSFVRANSADPVGDGVPWLRVGNAGAAALGKMTASAAGILVPA